MDFKREDLPKKYAYSIKQASEMKKTQIVGSKASLPNNFYDEIELEEQSIKENKKILDMVTQKTLKEFVYSNREIPDKWRNKLDFRDTVKNLIIKDKMFMNYLDKDEYENLDKKKKGKTIIFCPVKLKQKYFYV